MNNPGVKNGLFLGLSIIALTFLIYFIEPKFFVAGWGMAYIGITLLVYILFMVKSGNEFKAENDGIASFGDLLKPIFLCAVIGGMMASLFSFVLYNYIDPDLPALINETLMESFEDSSFIPEDQIEEMRDTMEEAAADQYSFGKIMLNAAMGAIVGFIMSLIIAAIQKNERTDNLNS